jgi:hypothetical protein
MDVLNWRLNKKKEEKIDTSEDFKEPPSINGNWRIFNPKHQSRYKHSPLPFSHFISTISKSPGFENFSSKSFSNPSKSIRRRIIPSYGIIAHSITPDNEIIRCIVQKKDTIPYSEFLRDKLSDELLVELIPKFSKQEKERIIKCYNENRVKDLLIDLWSLKKTDNEIYILVEKITKSIEKYYDLFNDKNIGLDENPWEFPKGREHNGENKIRCALREWE